MLACREAGGLPTGCVDGYCVGRELNSGRSADLVPRGNVGAHLERSCLEGGEAGRQLCFADEPGGARIGGLMSEGIQGFERRAGALEVSR
jgi:hypothetical protein